MHQPYWKISLEGCKSSLLKLDFGITLWERLSELKDKCLSYTPSGQNVSACHKISYRKFNCRYRCEEARESWTSTSYGGICWHKFNSWSENSGQSQRSALECRLETQSVFIWNTVLIWLKLVSPFGIVVCFLLSYLTIYHFALRFYWLGGWACRGTGIILGTFCWLLFTKAFYVFDFSDMVNRQSFEKTVTYLIEGFDWRNQELVQEQNHLLFDALLHKHTSLL